MKTEPTIGGIYQHYKGKHYCVAAVARDWLRCDRSFVLYQGLYDDPQLGKFPLFVRDRGNFLELVGQNTPRFLQVGFFENFELAAGETKLYRDEQQRYLQAVGLAYDCEDVRRQLWVLRGLYRDIREDGSPFWLSETAPDELMVQVGGLP